MVLFLNCAATQAVEVAERIHASVEKHPFPLSEGKSINITVSIGVVSYTDVSNDLDRFIELADIALYPPTYRLRAKLFNTLMTKI